MDASAHFRDKKITVMRIGLLGRGVGDTAFLAECGANILVVDDAPQEVMQPSIDALKEFKNVRFKFGKYDLDDFRNCDLVLKGAGTPLDSPEIAEAHARGIPVRISADLFAEISGTTCIGVTGTRGKSTVVHMLAAIFKEAGKKVLLGGNVRGVSTLTLLNTVTPEHLAVLELDSWQLQGWGEAKMSPHIAVFATFYPDHLNYYHNDLDAYLADKANIFLYQKPEDTLILGKQCAATIIEKYGNKIGAKTQVVDELKLPDAWTLQVPGIHNRYNAALALTAARVAGVPDEASRRALAAFRGVLGRLELIAEKKGIKIYNDTTATTPEATLAALSALGTENTIVIAGGTDKGLELNTLIAGLKGAKRLILLAGSGTERIQGEFPDAPVYDALALAIEDAISHAKKGDTVLFSPAFTSFGMFKNEFDRGDQFNALIEKL